MKISKAGFITATEVGKFVNVPNYLVAEQLAAGGRYVVASIKIKGGTGHIATLTGDYGGDKKKILKNINTFQAGASFGPKTLEEGFGLDILKGIKFYHFIPAQDGVNVAQCENKKDA